MKTRALTALLFALTATLPAGAADFSDPTWPCIQRKIESLSPGLMWPAAPDTPALSPEQEAAVTELVGYLTLRRLPLEETRPQLDAFTKAHGTDPALIGHVFTRAFAKLNTLRSRIIEGIGEYSLGQIDLAARIDAARSQMSAEMAKEAPDYDLVDKLEEQVDWDERIYTDRRTSLTYVCETPVLLEKRLYAIAQMLQSEL
ncbi:hypothetical protein [Oceanicola sp. 502str15]|uniref:hypothetical protein n=1 Tax=Oceanicola sp. 502str15 TaxID=2696061 RepID=UPI0020954980|nr:hypothetical protein [Oceanicola sp. 502str15]MCO6382094.1 hypothetical protein [Oceanicola sp. 502str15]